MKSLAYIPRFVGFVCLLLLRAFADAATGSDAGATDPNAPFKHPGLLTSPKEVEFIRARLKAGQSPWIEAWQTLLQERQAFLAHTPRPHPVYDSEPHWSKPGCARDLLEDARAVYGNTLIFLFTRDQKHAVKAEQIIDAWADVKIPTTAQTLFTTYSWPQVMWSAELLRAYDRSWPVAQQQRFDRLLREQVVPIAWIEPHWHNNWYSWSVCCRMCCAIYLDDKTRFDEAVNVYRVQLPRYIHADGISIETSRDLWHTQMGMAPLVLCGEMAWHQGIDLYSLDNNRLLKGIETHIPFIEGDKSNWPPGLTYNLGVNDANGTWWNMYELAWNEYHNRMGLETPNIERVVMRRRPEPFWRIGWGTLMHDEPAGLWQSN
jgi:hypothetical protein